MRKFSYTYKICHAYYYNTTAVMQNNIYQNVVLLVYGFKLYQTLALRILTTICYRYHKHSLIIIRNLLKFLFVDYLLIRSYSILI